MDRGKHIVIIGASFAGYTAALELKDRLRDAHRITVLSRSDEFLFTPSLIWVPFGLRQREDLHFPLGPVLAKRSIDFRRTEVTALDLPGRQVQTEDGPIRYDYLVIATGPRLCWDAVPGLRHAQSIFTWQDASDTRAAFEQLVAAPGPIVIGAVPGASAFHQAYEFLFNLSYQLRQRGLKDSASLTYVTPEPYIGHLGLGGFGDGARALEGLFAREHIRAVPDAAIRAVEPGRIHLADGTTLPYRFAMLAPPFAGVPAVAACGDIVDGHGFVQVDPYYRTQPYPEVFAAGAAVSMPPTEATRVPCAVPRSGYLSEEMAKVVAHNIAAELRGDELLAMPPAAIDAKYVLDAGDTGIIMTSDHYLPPRDHAWLLPGPEAHWAKLAFEKLFLLTHRRGRIA